MADEFDVEEMLEAPYRKEDSHHGSSTRDRERDRDRGRDKDRDRHKEKERKRSRSRDRHERRRSRSKERRDRDRGHDRERERHRRSRSRERDSRRHRRSRSPMRRGGRPRSRSLSPIRDNSSFPFMDFKSKKKRMLDSELTSEERDARTVFCMQLSARIRPRDLEEFFSSVGKVRDVRIITDNKTRRSKGIAYVEFKDTECVPLALGLTNQRLLGVPIIVQVSQAEKNRQALAGAEAQDKGSSGPMRLYVGSLHFNITEEMLRGIFEPFGKIEHINLIRESDTGRSKGFGFVSFHSADDAKKALEQLNGFELAGRPMKVGHVTERSAENQGGSMLDSEDMDRAGVDLGATGRLQLMAKLAEGTGFDIPQAAASALNMPTSPQAPAQAAAPPIATQCFMLSNMFDPNTETAENWDVEIRDDVIDECNKHGGVLHIYVDKASPQGNVYVKCPSISAAVASVNALHGRYFAGKIITAAYVPLPNYHALFPEALRSTALVLSSSQQAAVAAGAMVMPPPQPLMQAPNMPFL